MKKSFRFTAFLLALIFLFSACSNSQTSPTQTTPAAEDTTAPTTQPHAKNLAASPTDYVTEAQMALADPWAGSDESAIAAVMRKAEAGETVTIAVIGGSITQGTISNGSSDKNVKNKQMYAEIFRDWWKETFPDTEIVFINAGIGATDSYLAVHRVQEDVLAYDPDLVLVEFSVNDSSSNAYKTSYDNLLRTMLLSEQAPAVMLLFMAQTNGSTAQDIHSLVGFSYSLPMVSYYNVMSDMLEQQDYTAGELSGDEVHPSALGHRITGEILWKYLNSVYENADQYREPDAFDRAAFTKDKYVNNPRILDSTSITPASYGTFENSTVFSTFPNSWTTTQGGEITFEITCRNLGVLYYCQTNGNGGQFEVLVDGEVMTVLNADFSGGWGNYAQTQECYTSDEAAAHTVTIRMCADSSAEEITILGFLVSE